MRLSSARSSRCSIWTERMNGCVAVFDVGKTNIKVVVFDAAGEVLAERCHPNAPLAA